MVELPFLAPSNHPHCSTEDAVAKDDRATAALTRLRGFRQQLRRHLHGNASRFLDNIIKKQLEMYLQNSPTDISPSCAMDTEDESDTADTEKHAHVNAWCEEIQELYRQSLETLPIILETQTVTTESYKEGQAVVDELGQIVRHLTDIYFHAVTCELEQLWKAGKLLYQKQQSRSSVISVRRTI